MKAVKVLVDSEFGLTEKEARDAGFGFVPILIEWDGKEMKSGIDATLEFIYANLTKETTFKTSAPTIGSIEEEYRRNLKEAEHVFVICLSKHLSSAVNVFELVARDPEFNGKVTVYDSEFIGPWALLNKERLISMMEANAPVEKYTRLLDKQEGNMWAWLFPGNLDRAYASGRLSKAQYLAGSLLRITPVMPVINGRIDNGGVVKTRSEEKAIIAVVDNTVNKFKELKDVGLDPIIMIARVNSESGSVHMDRIKEEFSKHGFENVPVTWLPPAVVGHIGIDGIGAGVAIKIDPVYKG